MENKINDRKEFIDKVIRVTKDSFPFLCRYTLDSDTVSMGGKKWSQ